jgi:hypothetical protein
MSACAGAVLRVCDYASVGVVASICCTQAIQPKRERLGLRLESDGSTLPQLPPRLRLRLPLDNFPDDTAGLN